MEHGRPWDSTEPLEELLQEAYQKCIPLSASAELTLKCNIRCIHCYNFDRNQPLSRSDDELKFEDWKRLFRELKDEGTLFLSLTGGEAMVHPRFWDLLDEASALKFAVSILSNGTLLTDKVCDRLARYASLTGVALSVYGATAEIHDAITQVRGSWEKTIRGAEGLHNRGIHVRLKFVILKGNAHETEAMIELSQSMGLPLQVETTITGRYDGTKGSLATRVDIPTLGHLYRGPLRSRLQKKESHSNCACARSNCGIFSTGEVSPCIAVPLSAGNVLRQSFGEIWRSSPIFQRIRSLRPEDFPTCAPCSLKPWCRRSPGPPTALHGDFTGIDPWVCEEAAEIKSILEES